jgi:hypothetical protein
MKPQGARGVGGKTQAAAAEDSSQASQTKSEATATGV